MDHACPHLRVAGGGDEDDEDDEDGSDGADGAAEFAMGIDPTQPVYVFELGSGSARLAYNVVTRLAELTRGHRWLRRLRIVYVMTDFARKNVDFWMRHAPLQPLFEGSRAAPRGSTARSSTRSGRTRTSRCSARACGSAPGRSATRS